MTSPEALLPPGFRFHPTDEELILHYLRKRVASQPCPVSIIAEVDIYKFDPWGLPEKAVFGEREWYFFTPRDRKYPNGLRPNRAAGSGYWKATGTDKPIAASLGGGRSVNIGVKKALVFYVGKPPKGTKTNWIMHEYRLTGPQSSNTSIPYLQRPLKQRDASMRLDDWVLCRIYKKNNHSQATPTPADTDREDSNVDDSYLPTLANFNTTHNSNSSLKLPKSASLSDFLEDADYSTLSRLLHDGNAAAAEMPDGGAGLFSLLQANHGSDPLIRSITSGDRSLMGSGGMKRQRTMEENNDDGLHQSKNYINSSWVDASSQCNSMSQPYLKQQQIMLNPHLGFQ